MAPRIGSVLFACGRNTVRSPMAEALMKHMHRHLVFADSVGVWRRESAADPFAVAVVAEIGLDLSRHRPKSFDDLHDTSFDMIVTFSPEAHHRAMEVTRTMACEVEYWPTQDPTLIEGSREVRLHAYREVRDHLLGRIRARFPSQGSPEV